MSQIKTSSVARKGDKEIDNHGRLEPNGIEISIASRPEHAGTSLSEHKRLVILFKIKCQCTTICALLHAS
jgi:hypothetical protein